LTQIPNLNSHNIRCNLIVLDNLFVWIISKTIILVFFRVLRLGLSLSLTKDNSGYRLTTHRTKWYLTVRNSNLNPNHIYRTKRWNKTNIRNTLYPLVPKLHYTFTFSVHFIAKQSSPPVKSSVIDISRFLQTLPSQAIKPTYLGENTFSRSTHSVPFLSHPHFLISQTFLGLTRFIKKNISNIYISK
jgi:hypothetical protein